MGAAGCPAGTELPSDPAAPGLSTPGATRAWTCAAPQNPSTCPQQLHSDTKGRFKMLGEKTQLEILKSKLQCVNYYFPETLLAVKPLPFC